MLCFKHLKWVIDNLSILILLVFFISEILSCLHIWVNFIKSILFFKDNKLGIWMICLWVFINRNSVIITTHINLSAGWSLFWVKDRTWSDDSSVLGWLWPHSSLTDGRLLLSLWKLISIRIHLFLLCGVCQSLLWVLLGFILTNRIKDGFVHIWINWWIYRPSQNMLISLDSAWISID